jgi:hypothetical protein
MSDPPNPIRLELLGEMIRRLQADLRTVRDEGKLRDHLQEQHAERTARLIEVHTERIAAHEALTQSRLDQMADILFAIADKMGIHYRR